MIDFGSFSLLLSLILSALAMLGLFAGILRKDWRYVLAASRAIKAVAALMTVGIGVLMYSFLTDDFSIEYVSQYSEVALPVFYKITGIWAGQQGSLLFWGWLLAVFIYICIVKEEKTPGAVHLPYVLIFLNATLLFFLMLINFVTPPFELISLVPGDGNGLNPLLQNPGMVFHPPTLYLGYVGFAVPFAYAMAALVMGETGDWWIKKTRAWTLFAWLFLTLGIVFGGWWAYRELGWGGVWGWDPVENASIMPWFTATAFLHSVMIQERRGMLKVWNLVLIILTFSLSIFGTFLTRSGIITSVHAFGQSSVGYIFLVFLIFVLAVSGYLLLIRYRTLKEQNPGIESLISKESTFLYNNILLLGLCFATFWGTIFPLISELVKGVKISVGPPFFNIVTPPLFLVLIALMALCSLFGWRRTSLKGVIRNFLLPVSLMALSLPALYFIGVTEFMPMFFYAFSLFVTISLSREIYAGAKVAVQKGTDGWIRALAKLSIRNCRKYGGFLVHVGIILMVVGLAGYGYHQFKEEFTLVPGQDAIVKDFRLRYTGLEGGKKGNYEKVAAILEVYESGKFVGILSPEKRFYPKQEPSTEVAIMNDLRRDLYLILSGWERDETISLTVVINPLLTWVWVGTGVVMFGTLWAVLPRSRKDESLDALAAEYVVQAGGDV